MAPYSEDWRTIAEQASREMDPKKLAAVVSQLCCAFDERDKRHREKLQPLNPRCRQIPHCPERRCQNRLLRACNASRAHNVISAW
jgi:hypothetical protein